MLYDEIKKLFSLNMKERENENEGNNKVLPDPDIIFMNEVSEKFQNIVRVY
jgi:hypothetical protein